MYYGHNPKFPDNFMWGASSAAWQVEGGVADGGRTPAIIDLNSKTKKPFADNTYAADHYHHYKEDVALMAESAVSPAIVSRSAGPASSLMQTAR